MLDSPVDEGTTTLAPPGRFLVYLRRSAVYVTGPVGGRLLGLLVVPFVLAALGPDDFGRYEVLSTAGTAVASVLLLGLDLSTISLFNRPTEHRAPSVYPSALALVTIVSAAVIVVTWLFRSALADWWLEAPDRGVLAALVGLYAVGTLFALVGRAALRATDRASAHSSAVAATSIGTAVCTVIVLLLGATLDRIMVAQVGGAVFGAALAVFWARGLLRGTPERAVVGSLVVMGLPQLVAMAALWGGELTHRLLLLRAAGPSSVATLGIAARVATALAFVVIGLQAAWHPRVFAQVRAGDEASVRRDAVRVVTLMSVAALAVCVAAPLGVRLLGASELDDAVAVTGWAVVTALGMGMFQVAALYTVVHRRFSDAAVAAVVGAIAGLATTAVVVADRGAVGAAIGMAVGQWISALAAFGFGRVRELLDLFDWRMVLPVLVAVPACVVVSSEASLAVRVALALAAVAVSVVLAFESTMRGARRPLA